MSFNGHLGVDEITGFQKAIGHAHWNLNLDRFAEVVGSEPEHDWTQEKFRQLSALNNALNAFDAVTLAKIVVAGTRPKETTNGSE